MKIPKTLKIGGHIYAIKLSHFTSDIGETNRGQNIIYIDETLPPDQQEATLIHEILHAINSELDHALLDSLSEQIYALLKDNKFI